MPDFDAAISLVIGGWALVDHTRQITISTEAWMQFDGVKQLAARDGRTKSRPRCFIVHWLPADAVN